MNKPSTDFDRFKSTFPETTKDFRLVGDTGDYETMNYCIDGFFRHKNRRTAMAGDMFENRKIQD